jgi:hypothetical protein
MAVKFVILYVIKTHSLLDSIWLEITQLNLVTYFINLNTHNILRLIYQFF